MAVHCEKVRGMLDGFYDNELSKRKRSTVREHLRRCEKCSNEFEKLETIGSMLRMHYEQEAGSESITGLWDRVSKAIEVPIVLEPESLRDRLIRVLAIPKPAWAAVGAFALVLILAISYMPGNHAPVVAADDCIIDSVSAEGCSVMVYEAGNAKMQVIWVMDLHNEKAELETGVPL